MAICCCQAVQRLSIVSKLLGDEIVARTRLAARDTAQVSVSSARARASVLTDTKYQYFHHDVKNKENYTTQPTSFKDLALKLVGFLISIM